MLLRSRLKFVIILSMKNLAIFLLFYSSFLGCAHADVTEYDIELIIFEDKSGRYANSEQWRHEPPVMSEEPAKETGSKVSHTASRDSSSVLNISKIDGVGLGIYANKLKSSKRYKVLVHKAWRQTGLADDMAIEIPVSSRPTSTDSNNIHGTIKIVLARYLHIYADLIYQKPRKGDDAAWQDNASEQYEVFPVEFHRRMRSNELHYLDHPLIGILVKALPVKKNEGA